MKTILSVTSALFLLLMVVSPVEACKDSPAEEEGAGDDCSFPPADAWSVYGGGTYDFFHIGGWADSSSKISKYWNAIEGESCDWDEGWGFHNVDNLNLPLSRLLNGAYLVDVVDEHASVPGWGLWRGVKGLFPFWTTGRWFSYLDDWGADEWEPSCQEVKSDGKKPAAHHNSGPLDEYNAMHNPGTYRYTALERAALMLHEITHQEISHIDADECPAGASCDVRFGNFNATTMQINFLHDAYLTYYFDESDGEPKHIVTFFDGYCYKVPRFSDVHRKIALDRAKSNLETRFKYMDPNQTPTQIDNAVKLAHFQSAWDCKECDPSQFNFVSGSCSQAVNACNEFLNPVNKDVNLINTGKCQSINNAIDDGLTPEEVSSLWDQFTPFLGCQPVSESAVNAYCEQNKSSATSVTGLDPCGWLASVPVGRDCIESFCQEKFQQSGGWAADQDPLGCAEVICTDSCSTNASTEQCMADFVMGHGDPDYYTPPCQSNSCDSSFIHCVRQAYDDGTWTYPEPPPPACVWARSLCTTAKKLATMVLIEQLESPFLDPGPYHLQAGIDEILFSVRDLTSRASEARDVSGRGDFEQAQIQAAKILDSPELMTQLFHATPGPFVWMFGRSRTDLLGPELTTARMESLTSRELTPAGRRALSALRTLLENHGNQPISTQAGEVWLGRVEP